MAAAEPVEGGREIPQGRGVDQEHVGDLAPVADTVVELVERFGEVPGLEERSPTQEVAEPEIEVLTSVAKLSHRGTELALVEGAFAADHGRQRCGLGLQLVLELEGDLIRSFGPPGGHQQSGAEELDALVPTELDGPLGRVAGGFGLSEGKLGLPFATIIAADSN